MHTPFTPTSARESMELTHWVIDSLVVSEARPLGRATLARVPSLTLGLLTQPMNQSTIKRSSKVHPSRGILDSFPFSYTKSTASNRKDALRGVLCHKSKYDVYLNWEPSPRLPCWHSRASHRGIPTRMQIRIHPQTAMRTLRRQMIMPMRVPTTPDRQSTRASRTSTLPPWFSASKRRAGSKPLEFHR